MTNIHILIFIKIMVTVNPGHDIPFEKVCLGNFINHTNKPRGTQRLD